MRPVIFLCLLALLLGCSDKAADPPEGLTISGITPTDNTGALMGAPDTDDWTVSDGHTPYPVDRSPIPGWQPPPAKPAIPVPTEFAAHPAFPNPSPYEVYITHDIPVGPCEVYTWVLNERKQTVYRERLTASFAGTWGVHLDFTYGQDDIPTGMYRVVYEYDLGDQVLHGYGDVQYIGLDDSTTN